MADIDTSYSPTDGCNDASVNLVPAGHDSWTASGVRIIDRAGRKILPIGDDGFETAIEGSVIVDKTMLIANVLDSRYKTTLFCRPRRFGKTLNMTMLKAHFEILGNNRNEASLFEGTDA